MAISSKYMDCFTSPHATLRVSVHRNDRERIVQRLNIIRHAAIIIFLIALTACATSPWDQEQADAHMNIGIAYLSAERHHDALKELLQAEGYAPRDPRVHYYLGLAYYRKGLSDNAADEFKKALSLKSDYSEAHNFLGHIYLEKGLWDNAIGSFKNALSNILYETPDKALFNMGMAYHGKGDYKNALKMYEEAKNKEPHTVPAPLIDHYMGITSFAQGDVAKAVLYFKASLKTAPSLIESRYWLGQCYIKMHEPEKAKAEFKAVITATPESGLGTAAKKSLHAIESRR